MTKRIAVIDDEPDILELVSLHLIRAGFKVSEFSDVERFNTYLASAKPDLVILDLMLPNADGMDVCKKMKNDDRLADIPIIMLTARTEETDRILGLELGADDYVTKPFSPRELVARVKAVLRRGTPPEKVELITVGEDMVIDCKKFLVIIDDKRVELTPTEFRILKLLAERQGWVYTRDKILDYLWGSEKVVLDRTVDVHVKHLREKLGPAGEYVKNVRGVGYKLEI
jgi:two-component system phosphate regulon response regulator PhoB/two-component system alkaline phosphatase synthesis response regulator PhoP